MAASYPITARRPLLPPNSYVQFPIAWGARGLVVALLLALAALLATLVVGNNHVNRLQRELSTAHMVYDYARGNEDAGLALTGSLRETIVYVSRALREDNSPEALRALDTLTQAALEDDPSVRERKLAHAIETAWAALTISAANQPFIGHDGRG